MRLALNLHVEGYLCRFLPQNIGRDTPDRMVLKASWVPPWNFWPPRHPAGGRGAETYVAPPSAGRRPAARPPQVLPPAGPSHLTPSRPGEAKSRSDEAPRCPNQNENPNQKTAGCQGDERKKVPTTAQTPLRRVWVAFVGVASGDVKGKRPAP